jgi:hypothetical protein
MYSYTRSLTAFIVCLPFYYCVLTWAIYPRIKSRLVHWLDYGALSTSSDIVCVQLYRWPAQHWVAIDLKSRRRSEFRQEFAVTESGEERSDQYFRLDYWFYACEGSINWWVRDHINLITAKIFHWINIIITNLPSYHCLLELGIKKQRICTALIGWCKCLIYLWLASIMVLTLDEMEWPPFASLPHTYQEGLRPNPM